MSRRTGGRMRLGKAYSWELGTVPCVWQHNMDFNTSPGLQSKGLLSSNLVLTLLSLLGNKTRRQILLYSFPGVVPRQWQWSQWHYVTIKELDSLPIFYHLCKEQDRQSEKAATSFIFDNRFLLPTEDYISSEALLSFSSTWWILIAAAPFCGCQGTVSTGRHWDLRRNVWMCPRSSWGQAHHAHTHTQSYGSFSLNEAPRPVGPVTTAILLHLLQLHLTHTTSSTRESTSVSKATSTAIIN